MVSLRSGLPVSSTCGRCGYAACICYKAASKAPPFEYAPFGIYRGGIPSAQADHAIGYGDPTGRFRTEVDGLQAGVKYLDELEQEAEESPMSRFRRGSLQKLLETEKVCRALGNRGKRGTLVDQKPATPVAYSACPQWNLNPKIHDSTDQFFEDGTLPCWSTPTMNPGRFHFDYLGNESDSPELDGNFFSVPSQAQGQSTGVAYGPILAHAQEERGYASQQYRESKPLPTTYEVPSEEPPNPHTDEPPTIAKKVPQKSQWATLQELRLSSRVQYMKFIRLTTNHDSRGIKMLRRMYGSSKGMLDAGIATFGDVLDGHEPQSLKDIFAFTCLSYVMSKLLQKHGRMEGTQVLADTDRWRLAIKKEKDRLVYDQVVKILWPEIDFLKEHSKEKDATPTPSPPQSDLGNMVPLGNSPTGILYVPSSMLAYGMTTSSDLNFLERARAADCSNIENDMQSALQDSDNRLDPDNDYGFHDHLTGLLQETTTHENFMLGDFLNFCDAQLENNLDTAFEKQPPEITATHPPDRPPQPFPPDVPVGTLDPKILGNSSPSIASSEVLVLVEPLSPREDGIPAVPSLLVRLIDSIMFEVVVEFIKFVTSLGELLFRLSGCGITSRRKKHEFEGCARPVQDFGEFVTGAVKFVLKPIKEDLGEADESVDAVLCMADTFVRLGRLQSVREIEEYIITTARHLVCDFASFITLVSKTLRRCLSASDRMTWDHVYPSYAADQEDYSITYIKKAEATEIEWALQNLEKEDDGEKDVTRTAKAITLQCESNLSSNSDSLPSKKQKLSIPSPKFSNEQQSSVTPASSSGGDLPSPSKAHCHYANCKNSYTGKDARVNLRRHIRTVHEECKAIKCPTCGHKSLRRDNVRKHFLLKHKGEEMPAVLMCKTRA